MGRGSIAPVKRQRQWDRQLVKGPEQWGAGKLCLIKASNLVAWDFELWHFSANHNHGVCTPTAGILIIPSGNKLFSPARI